MSGQAFSRAEWRQLPDDDLRRAMHLRQRQADILQREARRAQREVDAMRKEGKRRRKQQRQQTNTNGGQQA